jgi:hypothetical protein
MKRKYKTLAFLCAFLSLCMSCRRSESGGRYEADPRPAAGRLSNAYANRFEGFAATDGEAIYFAGAGAVYRVDGGSSKMERVFAAEGAGRLCVDEGTLYYTDAGRKAVHAYGLRTRSRSVAFTVEGEILWLDVARGEATLLEKGSGGNLLKRINLEDGSAAILVPQEWGAGDACVGEGHVFATVGNRLISSSMGANPVTAHEGKIAGLQPCAGRAFFVEAEESVASVLPLGQGFRSSYVSSRGVSSLFAIQEDEWVYSLADPAGEGSKGLVYRKGSQDTLLYEGSFSRAALLGDVALIEGEFGAALVGLDGSYGPLAE